MLTNLVASIVLLYQGVEKPTKLDQSHVKIQHWNIGTFLASIFNAKTLQ
jgi:hypothetical protein